MQKGMLLKVKNKMKGEREKGRERKGEGKAGRRKGWEAEKQDEGYKDTLGLDN